MFKLTLLAGGLLLATAAIAFWQWPMTPREPMQTAQPEPRRGELEAPECVGCGDARHPTARLSEADFRQLVASYDAEPATGGQALDALCYYGPQAGFFLDQLGGCGLSTAGLARLKHELARDHVYFSVRVIDAQGVERLTLKRSRTPFDANVHHHLDFATNVPPCEISGTLKRVGQNRIWARF